MDVEEEIVPEIHLIIGVIIVLVVIIVAGGIFAGRKYMAYRQAAAGRRGETTCRGKKESSQS